MKTKKSKNKLGKVVLIGAILFAGSVMISCESSDDTENDTTENDNTQIDSVDTVVEPIDTSTIAMDTLIDDEILEEGKDEIISE